MIRSAPKESVLNRRDRIEESLVQSFGLQHLEVTDESHGHNVPDGAESHFKIVAVSEEFAGKRLIQRHRMINELLASEFAGGMHALRFMSIPQTNGKPGSIRRRCRLPVPEAVQAMEKPSDASCAGFLSISFLG